MKKRVSRRAFLVRAAGAVVGSALLGDKGVSLAAATRADAGAGTAGGTVAGTGLEIEWLGHGSFLFTSAQGKRILIDPWISTNPSCPGKYRKRKSFGSIDLVLWTHGHVDHFMLPDAKAIISDYNPKVIAPWELSFFIKSEIPEADTQTFTLGNKGSWASFDGIRIAMVAADHSSGAQLTGFQGTNKYVGDPVGYIFAFENGMVLYHAGDTALFGDMKDIIHDYYKPEVAILPIGGVFTMGPDEAAHAVAMIAPKVVIPAHYATFPVLAQSADGFVDKVRTLHPATRTLVLTPGTPERL
ncbi:MAG: metal-dependent hydrolase [Desulfovibrionaceae bacterium]